jgi:predicted transcriptional regulator
MRYHMLVARKEVLVQLDDELVARLDTLAEREGTSRSELLRRGAVAVLEALSERDDDDALREAYRRAPQDPAVVRSARRLAARTAPEW